MNLWKTAGCFKTGRPRGDSDIPFREDKLVKRALKEGCRAGIYSEYAKDVVRPSAQECAQNGRARSTKMRWAVRSQ